MAFEIMGYVLYEVVASTAAEELGFHALCVFVQFCPLFLHS